MVAEKREEAKKKKKVEESLDAETKLFVGMISKNVDEYGVRELFSNFGEVRIGGVEGGGGMGGAPTISTTMSWLRHLCSLTQPSLSPVFVIRRSKRSSSFETKRGLAKAARS